MQIKTPLYDMIMNRGSVNWISFDGIVMEC